MVDLHTHSTCSDGTNSPRELVGLARDAGVTALALTDHDTITGLQEAQDEATRLGIRLILGVEVSCHGEHGELHLLGLGLDPARLAPLQTLLEQAIRDRADRNTAIIARARGAGVQITYQELLQVAGPGSAGRPHIAALLVQQQTAASVADAFDRFLAPGRAFYVERRPLPWRTAAAAVQGCGGRALLAHPGCLRLRPADLDSFVADAAQHGLDGIEVWHPSHGERFTRHLQDLAQRLGIVSSGGSDYHGPHVRGRRLGWVDRKRQIPVAVAEPFLTAPDPEADHD